MKSEVSRTSGEQILDESDIDYCIRNVSVQTGEEFSPHFLQNLTQRRKMHTSGESSQEYQQDNSTLGRTIQTPKDSPQGFHGTSTRIPTGIQFNPNDNLLYEYQMDSRSDLLRNLQDSTGRYYQYHQHPQMYTNENRIPKEKMKFLCSFGGRISTKPNDGKLRYVGGETRIISIKKNLNYQDLLKKTFTICKQPHVIKYQLPGEDLDSLISVCSDEDFHHMIDEYLELEKGSKRLRIFLEPLNSESHYSSDNFHKYSVSVNDMTVPVPVPSPLKSSTDSITSFENEIPSSSNVAKKLLNPSQIMKSPSFQYRDTTTTSSQSKVSKENPFLDNITLESHKNDHITLEPAIQSEKFVTSHQQNPNVKRNEVARNNSSSLLDKLEDLALFVQNDDMIKEKTQTYKCENLPVIPRGKQYSELDQETVKWMEKNNLSFDFNLDIEEYQYHHNLLSPATPLERQLSMATTVSSDGLHNSSLETSRMDMNAENDRFTPDLVYSNSQTSEDVIDNLPLDILLSTKELLHIQEIHKENKNLVPKSDNKNAENEKRIKGGSISDATMAEIQAGIHGLQTIKNSDLEELSELGCGTFGTVYHGKWRGTDVAIKRIKESCFAGKPSEQDRLTKDFWREAQILSQLHHPNVVALYGVVRDGPGGTLSTVTEYMANGSLRHVLSKRNKALDYRKRLIIAQDAAIGMEYLHLKNIVHFDLKCDNLLVNLGDPDRPVCKVGDFGLSRMKRNTLVSGGARGTLPWIAPELLDGSSNRVSEKVDVFSFGIVMWEILTGDEPYADMHCGAIIGGIVTNTLRPPIPRHCDHDWRALMEKCWSNDPKDRPSFTQIANKLQSMSLAFQSKTPKRSARQ